MLGRHAGFPSSPRYLELADSADYFISKENWSLAENKIIEALRLEPANFSNSMLLSNLGYVQTQKGEYDKAVESLSMGLSLAPSSTVLLNNRAHAYLLSDKIDKAIIDLDKSLSIDSVQEWTLQTRGFIYLQNNETDDATRILKKLRDNFPDNSAYYYGMALICEANADMTEAKRYFSQAIYKNPDDDETREAYIFFLIKNNEYSEARSEIRTGLEKNPENAMYYLLRGYLHKLNYRLDEAKADKKIAISKGLDASYVSAFIP
ncbi:MAG: tetratricopeptide repeat protein [Muribaculaceae bacterium]|nr:tetratricopeptide repeat protein [Muribaculaceae bacterium]